MIFCVYFRPYVPTLVRHGFLAGCKLLHLVLEHSADVHTRFREVVESLLQNIHGRRAYRKDMISTHRNVRMQSSPTTPLLESRGRKATQKKKERKTQDKTQDTRYVR